VIGGNISDAAAAAAAAACAAASSIAVVQQIGNKKFEVNCGCKS
jgi:hypothetical protein